MIRELLSRFLGERQKPNYARIRYLEMDLGFEPKPVEQKEIPKDVVTESIHYSGRGDVGIVSGHYLTPKFGRLSGPIVLTIQEVNGSNEV